VKFGPGIKEWAGEVTAEYFNGASVVEDPVYQDDFVMANATIKLIAK